ncbi:MAG: hypothetical protein WA821_24025 [Anaerolineales bacterium]
MKLNLKMIAGVATTLIIVFAIVIAYSKYSDARASEKIVLPFDSSRPNPSATLSIIDAQPQATQQILPGDVVSSLINKAAKTINQPGWVHIREIEVDDVDRENNGVLPSGKVLALSSVTDTWYHINSDGLVYESVSIEKSDSGETIQTGIFTNNSAWSSADNETSSSAPFDLGSLDGGFAANAQDVLKRSSVQPEFLNARDSIRAGVSTFVTTEKQNPPLSTDDYKKPVYSISMIVTFDNVTGFLIESKEIMKFGDNSERTFYRVTQKIDIGAKPPAEILALIAARR